MEWLTYTNTILNKRTDELLIHTLQVTEQILEEKSRVNITEWKQEMSHEMRFCIACLKSNNSQESIPSKQRHQCDVNRTWSTSTHALMQAFWEFQDSSRNLESKKCWLGKLQPRISKGFYMQFQGCVIGHCQSTSSSIVFKSCDLLSNCANKFQSTVERVSELVQST